MLFLIKKVTLLHRLMWLMVSLGLSSCSVLGVGYNDFLCQQQDTKNKCVSASAFLAQDQQQEQTQPTVANITTELSADSPSETLTNPSTNLQNSGQPPLIRESSGNLIAPTTDPKSNHNHLERSLSFNQSLATSDNPSNSSNALDWSLTDLSSTNANTQGIAINGLNQALTGHTFLVTGYYAFPYLQYPQVVNHNYLVVYIAPIKLQGKVYSPKFLTIPYLH